MTVTIHPAPAQALDPALQARWAAVPPAVVADLAPETLVSPEIRPLLPPGQQPVLCARAVTAHCVPPNYGAVPMALDEVGPGEVLVIAAGGAAANAMIGGILGSHLKNRGAAGLICDGAVRDVAELAALPDFAVFTRHRTPRGPVGADQGAVHVSVDFGGVQVSSGDLILGDDDGMVVLPPARAVALIEAAEAVVARETRIMGLMAKGGSPLDELSYPVPERLG